jgi:hypothetical protein
MIWGLRFRDIANDIAAAITPTDAQWLCRIGIVDADEFEGSSMVLRFG